MSYLSDHYPDLDCDEFGNVYKNNILLKQFNSNGYKQIYYKDKNNKRRIYGVHDIMAMKFLDYFEDCVVHHEDERKDHNVIWNLIVKSKHDHCRLHALENKKFSQSQKGKTPWNKGLKMDEEFSRKCKEGIKNSTNRKNKFFGGNQYVDKYGNRK